MHRKRKLLIAPVVLCALGAGPLPAAHAEARPQAAQQLAALLCQGTESDAYAPGVTFQPHPFTITISGRLGSCLDTSGQVTRGAYGPEQVTIDAGCNDLVDAFQSSRTFAWNTGDSSVFQGNGQSTEVAGNVITTVTGTIVRGRLQGHSAVQTITLPQPGLLQCLTTGYTGATGITTLTIS